MSSFIKPEYIDSELTGRIIGCAMSVHTALGNGFAESIYQRSLEIEMRDVGIIFTREYDMPIHYKSQIVGRRRVDFLVESKIAVELKAVIELEKGHLAQAINYLEAYNLQTGLLMNFGSRKLQYHRLSNLTFKPSR
ncbi:MAG: GxxExxY protein [Candidatus Kapaibacterium sp.]